MASALALAKPSFGKRMVIDDFDRGVPPAFQLEGAPLGGPRAPTHGAAPEQAGSAIVAYGKGALVIDADSGKLLQLDEKLKTTASVDIGAGASQLVYDPIASRAYVADRKDDKIVVVAVGAKLEKVGSYATPAEPFGVALAPDRSSLLVTTVADQQLVALDPSSGKELWRHALGREPRGVAISEDGRTAIIGYLATGTVERVDLTGKHRGAQISLAAAPLNNRGFVDPNQSPDIGRGFARNAFAVRFIGNDLAIAVHQISVPIQAGDGRENTGSYGGGFTPPIEHRIAFLGPTEDGVTAQVGARVAVHQPQAIAWDVKTDTMYVAGYGSEDLLAVANASQASAQIQATGPIVAAGGVCGPQGLAVSDDGSVLVWCGVSRKVVRAKSSAAQVTQVATSEELTKSRFDKLAHRGMELFRAANDARVSTRGAMACASCHPEGREDGLSWRINGHTLQTPLLDGRVADTHPYKWDGGDADLPTSLSSTMRRLGGTGLPADDVKALSAFLEQLPAPRRPTVDVAQAARGQKLFDSELGCNTCHDGAKLTDRQKHDVGNDQIKEVDTPSLIGVASSAPYYHDGSAATLQALLRDNGNIHGMADTSKLSDSQISDLVAYLETL
ncbi:MAG TPA: c-type cytochrome [Kofleriaceae bacterium]|nr:c-type cytochrome [Kofleriaceae bacterium]